MRNKIDARVPRRGLTYALIATVVTAAYSTATFATGHLDAARAVAISTIRGRPAYRDFGRHLVAASVVLCLVAAVIATTTGSGFVAREILARQLGVTLASTVAPLGDGANEDKR